MLLSLTFWTCIGSAFSLINVQSLNNVSYDVSTDRDRFLNEVNVNA